MQLAPTMRRKFGIVNMLNRYGSQPKSVEKPSKAMFAVMGSLIVSTGSAFDIGHIDNWHTYVDKRVPIRLRGPAKSMEVKHDLRSAMQHIDNIRQVINPSVTDLAFTFGLTRQAVYKWIAGTSSPEDDSRKKIIELSRIADMFEENNVSRSLILVKMKTFEGKSILDLIREGAPCYELAKTLVAESKIMEEASLKAKEISARSRSSESWKSDISIPGAFV